MDRSQLKKTLTALSDRATADWFTALSERKRRELEFHNVSKQTRELAAELPHDTYERLHANKKYYSVARGSIEYVRGWLERWVPGAVFLDYACGNGDQTIRAAKLGSALALGIDISDVSVANARHQAEAERVADRCVFVQGDCENTGLPDACVDIVLCCGMLHHLDLSYAFPEMRRILKPGGRVLALEALGYNPAIALYRRLTPAMRTDWEKDHILSLRDVGFAARFFEVGEVRYWHLTSLLATFLRRRPRAFETTLRALEALDSLVLRVPGVRLMSWQFTFELIKRQGD